MGFDGESQNDLTGRGGRAAFERPLPDVQIADPDAGVVATAVQDALHQLGWSPLEPERRAAFQADCFGVQQAVVEVAQGGQVSGRVAAAVAPVPDVMDLERRTRATTRIGAFPAVSLQHEMAHVVRNRTRDRLGLGFTRRSSTIPPRAASRSTGDIVFWVSTIERSTQPNASTRFVWIEAVVPDDDDDGNPFTENATSGVTGYPVMRQ